MNYRYILITLIAYLPILTQSGFIKNFPDALRCGKGNNSGAIYFVQETATQGKGAEYCQVYNYQNRCVIFNADGAFIRGTGHEESRSGCTGKTLKQLKEQKRTFELVNNDQEIADLRARLEKLQAQKIGLKYDQSQVYSRTIETVIQKNQIPTSNPYSVNSLQKEP